MSGEDQAAKFEETKLGKSGEDESAVKINQCSHMYFYIYLLNCLLKIHDYGSLMLEFEDCCGFALMIQA